MQDTLLGLSLAGAILFIVAEFADHRRRNRRDVDNVGFMPWRGIALFAAAAAIVSLALWLHQG